MSIAMIRYRKSALKIHRISIGLWITAGGIMLLGAVLKNKAWISAAYTFIFHPAMAVAMITGIYLILVGKGKLFKKGWFWVKVFFLLGSMLFMGLYLNPLLNSGTDITPIYPISIAFYIILLLIILLLSMKKLKSRSAKRARKDMEVS
ncbi:hypothetical protein [Paenibacillus senegalensis]|uniref:hypothetical protein n=1 Tax=Paenibacillus senegalensis TaxID=1465766 RepID=UPI0002886787|nr:hypothetical protein [Paenibacillus senegalensis]